jgi:hypothetical protein
MSDAGSDATPRNVPHLAPGEIAYRDFAREPDGFAEQEVRTFLGEVADAVAAGRDRERGLEQRIRDLEDEGVDSRAAAVDDVTDRRDEGPGEGRDAGRDERVGELFAELRRHDVATPTPAKAPPAKPRVEPPPSDPDSEPTPDPVPTPDANAEPEGGTDGADDGAESPAELTGDDLVRARCDAVIGPLLVDLVRVTKRVLQDEQNVLLDAGRRARSRIDPDRVLPDVDGQRDTWAAALKPALGLAYGGGRTSVGHSRRVTSAPERVVNEIAAALLTPLRERLGVTIASVSARGPYESAAELHRELAGAIGARYREWRTADLETRLGDALAAAYARGTYDGAPSTSRLRWVTNSGNRCPDCDDNTLEPTVKGQAFPTGQTVPPAHPGCRCLLVVEPASRASATGT